MINKNVQAIILAAGKSTRFNTNKSKLVERICGKEMIAHTTTLLEKMNIPMAIVVGHKRKKVEDAVRQYQKNEKAIFVYQEKQLGTGHALSCTKHLWHKDHILVMNGDTPLLTEELLQKLIDKHTKSNAVMSFIVAQNVDPSIKGYGLVITENDRVRIVEEKHLTEEPSDLLCLNGGIYILQRTFIEEYIEKLSRNEQSGEIYLTDLAQIASQNSMTISIIDAPFDAVRGVNTLRELWVAEQIKRSELIDYWMQRGVRFSAAQNVHLDETVKIGRGTYIGNGVQLFGNTEVGEGSSICAFTVLNDAKVGNNSLIKPHTIVKDSFVGNNCKINSFTYIHGNSHVNDNCNIDSFIEIRNQTVEPLTNTKNIKKKEKIFMAACKTTTDKSFTDSI